MAGELLEFGLDDLFPEGSVVAMPSGKDVGGGDTAGWGRGLDGPVWMPEIGALAFNDIAHQRRLTWAPGGEVLLLDEGTQGACGSARDADGRILSCEWRTRRVTRREHDGATTLIAEAFEGVPFAGPDDVAVGPDGTIFFTDLRRAFPPLPVDVQAHSGVYRVAADLTSIDRLDCPIRAPGGVAVSGDGQNLFVSDQDERQVVAFSIGSAGLGPARRFDRMQGASESVPHGLCLDARGYLFVGGPGGVWVYRPDGTALGTVPVPATTINALAFGGDDGSTLFIATSTGVGAIATATSGTGHTAPHGARAPRGSAISYPQRIERLDPALDAIVSPEAVIENYCHGGFYEDLGGGPNQLYSCSLEGTFWSAADNCLFFSDIGNSRRLRFNPATGEISPAHSPTGHTNGATLDREGRILQAEHSGRCVSRLEHDGTRTVLADAYEGRRLNHPNDVVVRSDGAIFFTDPWWDFGAGDKPEIGFAGVYQLSVDLETLTLIGNDYRVCNGLAFNHDETLLFVNDSYGKTPEIGPHIRAYDVRPDGSIDSNSSRIWARLPLGKREGKPDGMKVDQAGNVYCGGAGGIWIFDKDGKHLGIIAHGDTQTNNLCFGGPDWKTLYFVSWIGLHSIQLNTPGIPLPPPPHA